MSRKRGADAVVVQEGMDLDATEASTQQQQQQQVQREQELAQQQQFQHLSQQEHQRQQVLLQQQQQQLQQQALAQATQQQSVQLPPDIASILQSIQQQLVHLPAMHEQLQTVTNKVAYLEARDDSDYDDCNANEEEFDDLVAESNKFFIGEGAAQAEESTGRGARRDQRHTGHGALQARGWGGHARQNASERGWRPAHGRQRQPG